MKFCSSLSHSLAILSVSLSLFISQFWTVIFPHAKSSDTVDGCLIELAANFFDFPFVQLRTSPTHLRGECKLSNEPFSKLLKAGYMRENLGDYYRGY